MVVLEEKNINLRHLLLSTKLTTFLNLDELGKWVLHIGERSR